MKQCTKCKLWQHENDYYKDIQKRDGLRPWYKDCVRHNQKRYQNTSTGKLTRQNYIRTENGKKACLKAQKRYRRSEKRKASRRFYKKSQKGKAANQIYAHNRRERQRNLDAQVTQYLIETTRRIFCNQCFNCSSKIELQIDHHYPLAKGFGLNLNNATLLCKMCNTIKGDRFPEDFYNQDQLITINYIHAILQL